MNDHSTPDAQEEESLLHLKVTPEPNGDEGEALIAAITVYLSASAQVIEAEGESAAISRWGSTGRRAGTRGIDAEEQMGWGRRGAGWP